MKLLVVGGSGFVGSSFLADALAAGHEVLNYDRSPSPGFPGLSHFGDVRDTAALCAAAKGMDAIVSLAAEHRDDVQPRSLYYDVNVGGARAIVAGADRAGVRTIVFASTMAVYGLEGGMPDETSTVRPFNDYGRSKLEAEEVYREWAAAEPTRSLVIVRPSVIFGENNKGNVYTLLKQIESGRFVMIGPGRNRKSMAYVKNFSRFLVRCLGMGPGQHLFNYADKPDPTTAELVETARLALGKPRPFGIPYALGLLGASVFDALAWATGRTFPISVIRVRKFCANTQLAADRVRTTGFEPPYTLQEGLRRMIAHEFGRNDLASPRAEPARAARASGSDARG